MLSKMIVLVDIDHTLSNATWRDPMLNNVAHGYDEYHAESIKDEPHKEMIELVNGLFDVGYHVYAVSARPEKFRYLTFLWLLKHNVIIHTLLLREYNSFAPAPETKRLLLKEIDIKQVAFAMDDREDCCAMYRSLGITTLQVSVP